SSRTQFRVSSSRVATICGGPRQTAGAAVAVKKITAAKTSDRVIIPASRRSPHVSPDWRCHVKLGSRQHHPAYLGGQRFCILKRILHVGRVDGDCGFEVSDTTPGSCDCKCC